MSTLDLKHLLSAKDEGTLRVLAKVADLLLMINPKMPLSYLRAFIEVALSPGKGPTAYANSLGLVQPVASRILMEIGPSARTRSAPDHLVYWVSSPLNGREKEYYLTPKGLTLMYDVLRALER
jgi:hypothetical protein